MFFRDRWKEPSPLALNVITSLLLGVGGGMILGAVETLIAILRYRGGAVAIRDLGPAILATPVLLYGLASLAVSLVIGTGFGLLMGSILEIKDKPRTVVHTYAVLYLVPLTALSCYLWKTRVLTDEPLISESALFQLTLLVLAYLIFLLVVKPVVVYVSRRRTTTTTRLVVPIIVVVAFLAFRINWGGMGSVGEGISPPAGGERPLNILLVTMDTQRHDFLRCYGDSVIMTPQIDALAARGAVFKDAVCHVPLTLPSHISIFTSTYPTVHGVRSNINPKQIPPSLETLAEVLRGNGYRNGAFVSAFILSSIFKLNRGFEIYDDQFENKGLHYLVRVKPKFTLVHLMDVAGIELSRRYERKADETTSRAIRWLRRVGDGAPFFLWVHYYDPHSYYNPPPPFDGLYRGEVSGSPERVDALLEIARNYFPKQEDRLELTGDELQAVNSLYRGEVTYMDHHLGRLITYLKDKDLLKDTIVVLTSDHGELLGEHDLLGHGMWVFEETIRIPLIFHLTGRIPAAVIEDEVVRSIDIMPTILELAGIPLPHQAQGRSLLPLMTGGDHETIPAYFETYRPDLPEKRYAGVRVGPWKYICQPWGSEELLFNLDDDPGERNNLVEVESDLAGQMRITLDSIAGEGAGGAEGKTMEMTPEMTDALRALGYIR